ncbi:MAG: A/G-specific adenine glycosylase [Parasphingorhabdus sp.]|jgi:A/G-specific adenine glycosylase
MSLIKTAPTTHKFSDDLLQWFDQYGRTHLPWKKNRDPYAIWVSEIMLQQTQVATVIGYFERFIQSFPDIATLANATQEQVLQHWAGLGYYARGRNLHKAAQQVVETFDGTMPDQLDQLQSLPGIGRSTAAAILAQAHDQRQAILDGNVKRVLARIYRVPGYPGQASVHKQLWEYAEHLTPHKRVADYTQAIMDLGAILCLRSRPQCSICPVNNHCDAFLEGDADQYPGRKPKTARRQRQAQFLLIDRGEGNLWLQQRPPIGIWGGLGCLVEIDENDSAQQWVEKHLSLSVKQIDRLSPFIHKFTHYDLEIQPIVIKTTVSSQSIVNESADGDWYDRARISQVGLPAPIQKLVEAYLQSI